MVSYALVSSGPGSFARLERKRKTSSTKRTQKTQELASQTIFLVLLSFSWAKPVQVGIESGFKGGRTPVKSRIEFGNSGVRPPNDHGARL
jgi:hypothetical protein